MTTKEHLQQAYRLARGIRLKRKRILELREFAGKSTSAITTDRVSGTSVQSRMEHCIVQIDEWEREVDEAVGTQKKVISIIRGVKNLDQRDVMELRYIDGLTWDEVVDRLYMSRRKVFYLHGEALKSCIVLHQKM